jgi:hypothetical protein
MRDSRAAGPTDRPPPDFREGFMLDKAISNKQFRKQSFWL